VSPGTTSAVGVRPYSRALEPSCLAAQARRRAWLPGCVRWSVRGACARRVGRSAADNTHARDLRAKRDPGAFLVPGRPERAIIRGGADCGGPRAPSSRRCVARSTNSPRSSSPGHARPARPRNWRARAAGPTPTRPSIRRTSEPPPPPPRAGSSSSILRPWPSTRGGRPRRCSQMSRSESTAGSRPGRVANPPGRRRVVRATRVTRSPSRASSFRPTCACLRAVDFRTDARLEMSLARRPRESVAPTARRTCRRSGGHPSPRRPPGGGRSRAGGPGAVAVLGHPTRSLTDHAS
jgi:hypothetical protein